ncbi:MAG: rhodanese-like domain-containing protein [Bacteroidales bacterium]
MKKYFILLAIFFNMIIAFAQNQENSCFVHLDSDEFYLNINTREAFLIDVRLFKEFRKNRIEGAMLASNKESLISLCAHLDKNTPIYIYCDESDRSVSAAKILCSELGFKKVYNLHGGLNEWVKKYPLDRSRIKKESGNY